MAEDIEEYKIVWKSEYNIGNLKIDQEHQNLFLLARKVFSINLKNNEDEIYCELKEAITQLYKYINLHFANEEAYMKKINYAELEHHKRIHKAIVQKLNSLIAQLNKLELQEIKEKLFTFINKYFIHHIITEDRKIQIWNASLEDMKKHFGWKEIYSVGDERIDAEHKKLFEIAQKALEETEFLNERNNKIKSIIVELYNYMKMHFTHEEEIMEEVKYPQLEAHKKIHEDIIQTVTNFVRKLPTMDSKIFEKELIRLIDAVIIQHIIQEDRKIINWVKQNKEKKLADVL